MKFEKLELQGFKSFADKVELVFSDNITAIVGPNGCGKSNVSDAIRWVLGEQSAKDLRGSSMQDVIFNGTQNRKSVGYCEASIVFNNEPKIFPVEFDKVVFTRKLYRSGESEYYINGQICRLMDITDLLHECSFGKDGFGIIGQGKIDEILSSKPEDRRAIFEEATGVLKYKDSKRRSESKLARTRDNISRINDIMSEIEGRVEPLRKQSEDAKKFLEINKDLKILELNAFIYQYENIEQVKANTRIKYNKVLEELTEAENKYNNTLSRYNEITNRLNSLDRELNSQRDLYLALSVEKEKNYGEVRLYQERIASLNLSNVSLKDSLKELEKKDEEANLDLSKAIFEKEEANKKLSELEDLFTTKNGEFADLLNDISTSQDEIDETQQRMLEGMSKLTETQSRMFYTQNEINSLEKQKDSLLNELYALENEFNTLKSNLEQLNRELQIQNEKRESINNNIHLSNDRYNSKLFELRKSEEEKQSLVSEKEKLQAKINALNDIDSNNDAFNHSVKTLLNDAKENNDLSSRIEGAVARLIEVPENLSLAIDVSLAAANQNVVVNSSEDAKYLIDYLKENKIGRVTFLPVESVKRRDLKDEHKDILYENGVLGVASNLIKYNERYNNIFSGLLGRTIIVDNIDNASIIAKKYNYEVKLVTLNGEIFATSGSITGGFHRGNASNLINNKNEIDTLNRKINELNGLIETIEKNNVLINKELELMQNSSRGLIDEGHGIDLSIASLNERIRFTTDEIQIKENNRSSLNSKINSVKESIARKEDILSGKESSEKVELSSFQSKYQKLRARKDEMQNELTNLKVAIAETKGNIVNLDNIILNLNRTIDSNRREIDRINDQINSNNESIRRAEIASKVQLSETDIKEQLEEIKAKLDNQVNIKEQLMNEQSNLDNERIALQEHIAIINSRKYKEETNLEKVNNDIEEINKKVEEEYGLDYNSALEFKLDNFKFETSLSKINSLKRQKNNLGFVNINAIEEYEQVNARYIDLKTQNEDLVKAEQDLVKIIKELSTKMINQFNAGFKEIAKNYQVIFRDLFGGGSAELNILPIEEGEDPLDAGIEIKAQPPGKRLENISLLSGGERALTAIAILFSILKMKPLPFCVLDEIEAPLDETNTERFARYMRRFAEDTQFIVITHKKQTMELADCLYGVTMEEKGISKLVSVKLSDALKEADKV